MTRVLPTSTTVLAGIGTHLGEGSRSQKRSKFGGVKYVYPRQTMAEMRAWFTEELERRLPAARFLYWT